MAATLVLAAWEPEIAPLRRLARAAAAAGVDTVAAVLGIANRVGPRGHQEWRAHHAAASRAACRLVWSLVKGPRASGP